MTRLRKIIETPDAREKLLRTESGIEYRLVQPSEKRLVGGEGGIRTPGTLIRGTHDFQSCTFNRSVTSPPGSTCEYHERADATIVLGAFLQMTKSFWKEEILALRPV